MDNIDWSQYYLQGEAEVERSDNLLVIQNNGESNIQDNGSITKHGIFFTINPCDGYWDTYNNEPEWMKTNEEAFRNHIANEFNKMVNYYRIKKQIKLDVHIHFEKGKRKTT